MATSNVVPKLYRGVIEDVIKNVRESFLNEGVDEQVLQELKQIWESKLLQSRAVDGMPAEGQVQATRQQYVYPHVAPHASIASQVQPVPREAHRVSIAPASVRVPDAVTPQQAASGQTAILYPSTHGHALGQMTAAASAATMAIPGHLSQLQSQLQQGTATHTYPTARTIQTTQQVGNLQQRIVNTAQPRHVIGTTQQQVIRTTQHQPTIVGNTQVTQVIRGAQPQVIRGAQPQVIRGAQPQVIRGAQPQVIRGIQPQVIRGAQPQVIHIRGPQPQVIRGAQPQVQVIRGAQPQVIRGAQPQVIRGAQPQVQVIRGAQPQVIRGAQPQVIRGAQPQVIRGTQPGTIRVTQPHVIQMTQLQAGEKPPPGIQVIQVDGGNDSDSEDDDDDDDDDDDKKDKSQEGLDEADFDDEDPLNSDDDVSEDDPADLFDTDNVVVCQFDKIARTRNKWKFHLKDGIMNLRGRDYVFQKANGEAEW